jgi:hypothetical protein
MEHPGPISCFFMKMESFSCVEGYGFGVIQIDGGYVGNCGRGVQVKGHLVE